MEHYKSIVFCIAIYPISKMQILLNSDPEIFRPKIQKEFSKLFQNSESMGINIEKGIFNYAIQEATYRQIIKKWKNPMFCEIYTSRLKTIMINIMKNKDLAQQIQSGEITPKSLAFMTHQELCPEKWRDRIEAKIKRERSKLNTNTEAMTDMFTCGKCKSKKCTYYEMQTRSADEPATIFVTCLDCGKHWKN